MDAAQTSERRRSPGVVGTHRSSRARHGTTPTGVGGDLRQSPPRAREPCAPPEGRVRRGTPNRESATLWPSESAPDRREAPRSASTLYPGGLTWAITCGATTTGAATTTSAATCSARSGRGSKACSRWRDRSLALCQGEPSSKRACRSQERPSVAAAVARLRQGACGSAHWAVLNLRRPRNRHQLVEGALRDIT